MAEATQQEGALGELFVECPRGHHVHIAWTDRPVEAGLLLDESEMAAVQRFTYEGGRWPVAPTKCPEPECGVALHGQTIQGRALT
jgi:hypothetical protein